MKRITVNRRCDRSELAPIKRTDEGFLIVEGFVATPGVLEYRGPKGDVIRELVLPENLHRSDDLETLKRKPVTLKHPKKDVDPRSVKQARVGSIGETVSVSDDGRVRVSFTVERSDAIKAVESGTHQLSPGYRVEIDPTPGNHPDFGSYDAIQMARRYNHLAIVDRARGGPSIHLRADEAYHVETPKQRANMLKFTALMMASGMTREDADPIGLQCEEEAKRRIDEALKESKERVEELEGEAKARKDAAPEPMPLTHRLDWFDVRSDLIELAKKNGIEGEQLKLDNDDLALAVVRRLDGTCGDDVGPAYVNAYLKIYRDAEGSKQKAGGSMYRVDADEEEDPKTTDSKDPVERLFDALEAAREKKLMIKEEA